MIEKIISTLSIIFIGSIISLWTIDPSSTNQLNLKIQPKEIETNLALDSMVKTQYYGIENTNIFPLKNKKISDTIWEYNNNCLQIPGIDICQAVVMSYKFNAENKKCDEIQTGWCSDWLHLSYWNCSKSCNWIKVIENLWKWYFVINNNLFFYNIAMTWVDTQTFQILDEWLAKDKNSLYIQWNKITRISINDILAIDRTEKFFTYNYSIITKKWIHKYGTRNSSWKNMKYLWLTPIKENENLTYFSKDWSIWNKQLKFQNENINVIDDDTYGINSCYIWSTHKLWYHWAEPYDITINSDYDLSTLKIHNCKLLEDEKWYIYEGYRITTESETYIKNNLQNYNESKIKFLNDTKNIQRIHSYDFE